MEDKAAAELGDAVVGLEMLVKRRRRLNEDNGADNPSHELRRKDSLFAWEGGVSGAAPWKAAHARGAIATAAVQLTA